MSFERLMLEARENAEQQLATAAGSRRSGCSGGSRLVASQQRWSPPSPKKLEEESRALQLYGGKAHTARELQLTSAADPDKHGNDPLYIGLPNYGNSCYQNATLQALLGLCPFLNDMIALHSGPESDQCRTLHAVAKLMVLRQKALSHCVSSHLSNLRDVFGDIDPAFRGTEMQDANEFLLRLLDTIKDEIDARQPSANPVRDNFQFQTMENFMCIRCQKRMPRWQESITWFVSVPRRQGSEVPTLQDALRLSMQPERRELLCQHCRHGECLVTTKVSQLPRTLILHLNRFFFRGDESKKVQANVSIPKFLYLNEYVADDVKRPPEWRCKKSLLRDLSDISEQARLERPPVPLLPPPAPAPLSPTPAPAPGGESEDLAAEQGHLSEFRAEDDQSRRSLDLAGDNNYRLVGVVSHRHAFGPLCMYVADVYSVGRGHWFHHDDRSVSRVQESDVLGDGHQTARK
ncbi:Ubiquitin carboxyl-terminal hydrolase 37 [Amphibalanus amphitrite]|uniref:Ubiquitin carboxyl-terminal hydrolase 37 n=1 Tax=Amphibalanus amphitrite TaxID=1232801 RepID=A0A6A4XD37_AMPAM|nr:Ubiquitin carboxyl-terminal hydrolase 37 [Amphibalanus amphitrite]